MRKDKKKNGVRKTSQKKLNKARWAWLEQVWLKIDELEERLSNLEESVKFIRENLESNDNGEWNGS